MRIAFFSDTHGTLSEIIADYDFSGVELYVFCGDCYKSDFEQLKYLNIPKIGTIGILLKARQLGLIPKLKPEIERLQQTGFSISSSVVAEILKLAGE